jgi:hypothetical protein
VAEAICVKLAALTLAFTGVLVEVEGNKDQREISMMNGGNWQLIQKICQRI